MSIAPLPPDEDARVASLRSLGVLDSGAEERFDRITRTAAALFATPYAFISLLDTSRQQLKSCVGMPVGNSLRETSFCSHTILTGETMVVEDATTDPRFADNATVTGPPHIRFYAGHPLADANGLRLGTLCVADRVPRKLGAVDRAHLRDLAAWAETELLRGTLAGTVTELRRSEARLWAIAESVAEGIVVFGEDGRIRFANSAAASMFGYVQAELAARGVASLIDGVTWGEIAPLLGAGGETPGDDATVIGERSLMRGRREDESTFPMEVVVSEARVEGERVLIAVGHDLTETERTEAAMRGSEHRFRAVFEHAGVGIVLLDPHSREIVDVNDAFASMLGYGVDELRGRDITLISHPDDMSANAEMREGLRSGGTERVERQQRFVHREGRAVWGTLTMSAMPGAGDRLVAVGVFEDRTEERETERIKDEFISVVGHELRTPLTSIRGYAELARMQKAAGANADDNLSRIESEGNRMSRLVEDLLMLARGEQPAESTPVRELVDVADLVEGAARDAKAAWPDRDVFAEAAPGLQVIGDYDQLLRAVRNLAANAAVHTAPDKPIVVRSAPDGDSVLIQVVDGGPGLPPEDAAKVFERFWRADKARSRARGGTGLGMSIVAAIVANHGGTVRFDSAVETGSTVTIRLPAVQY